MLDWIKNCLGADSPIVHLHHAPPRARFAITPAEEVEKQDALEFETFGLLGEDNELESSQGRGTIYLEDGQHKSARPKHFAHASTSFSIADEDAYTISCKS
jgi:hypothetical protein